MKKFKEKLAELGVLEKFEANFEKHTEVNDRDVDFITKYMSTKTNHASKLMCAFNWEETIEGSDFWLGVYLELLNNSNNNGKV